jgi:hypothetical protein
MTTATITINCTATLAARAAYRPAGLRPPPRPPSYASKG